MAACLAIVIQSERWAAYSVPHAWPSLRAPSGAIRGAVTWSSLRFWTTTVSADHVPGHIAV